MARIRQGIANKDGTVPGNIAIKTPQELERQRRWKLQRAAALKAEMFSAALPAKAASKKVGGRSAPAMPLLPDRPYVESSRGGGDVEHRFQIPLAMVARLIPADMVDKTDGGRAAVDKEWKALRDRGCWDTKTGSWME